MKFAEFKKLPAKLLKRTAKPSTDEVAALTTDIKWFLSFLPTFSPALVDPVVRDKGNGKGLELYDEVDRDPHAAAVLGTRSDALVGKDWFLKPASEDPRDQEIAENLTEILKRTNFDEGRGFLMQSRLYGVYYTEVMWLQFKDTVDSVVKNGQVGIKELIDKHPRKFVYTPERELRLLTPADMVHGVPVEPRKIIISRYGSRDIPYGKALGQRLWWQVWLKKNGIKFWLTFLEKFGSPSLHGKYPAGTSKPLQDDLLEALKALKNESGTITRNDMEIDLIESARRAGAGNPYMDLMKFMNSEMSKTVLGQTQTTEITGGTGSLASAKVHEGVRQDILVADASLEAEMFNTSLIPWLTAFNFFGAIPPRFIQRVEPEQDLKALAERDKTLVDMGFKGVPVSYVHDTYGIPHAEDGEEVIDVAPEPSGFLPEQPQFAAAKKKSLKKGVTGLEAQKVVDSRIVDGVSVGVGIFQPSMARLTETLERSDSYTEFRTEAEEIIDAIPLDDLRESVSQHQVNTDQIGQDAVLNELSTSERTEFDKEEEETSILFADIRFGPGMPFQTALDFYRSQNFEMAGDLPEEIKGKIGNAIDESIVQGTTYKDFIKEAGQLIKASGFSALSPWRLETIYRTNMQTAYQAGRYMQMTSPTLVRIRPNWRYVAVMDGATRPAHAAFHGKVYPANHSIWAVWYPPNGFNCRCYIQTVSKGEFQRRKLKTETTNETGSLVPEINPTTGRATGEDILLVPDTGFDHLPTER